MKKAKQTMFRPPLRQPPMNKQDIIRFQKVKAAYDKEMTEVSNNAFNLALTSALIAARDMGMSIDEVKEMLQRVFGVLDDVADDLARIEEMLRLVESWGIEIHGTVERQTQKSGATIEKKTAVFYLLQEGHTEIEDILTQCKLHNIDIDYRDACSFRWEFNKRKYYAELEKDMNKKDEVFKLLDQGIDEASVLAERSGACITSIPKYKYLWRLQNKEDSMAKTNKKAMNMLENGASKDDLVRELDITEAAAIRFVDKYNECKSKGEIEVVTDDYKKQAFSLFDKGHSIPNVRDRLKLSDEKTKSLHKEWIAENQKELSTDEMAEILSGISKPEIVILKHKGVITDGPKKQVKENVENDKAKQNVKTDNDTKEQSNKVEAETTSGGNKETSPYKYVDTGNGLKKKVKVIEVVEAIEGSFATYTPLDDNTWDVEIDGQIITLNKENLVILSDELRKVAQI